MTDTPTNSTDFFCDGCGCTIKQWDPVGPEQGEEMFVIPEAGGEKIYCQSCFNKR